MQDWTRRGVIEGLGAVWLAGCGGAASGGDPPPRHPRPQGGTLEAPIVRAGEPGTLFRPRDGVSLPRIDFVDPPAWFRRAPALYCPAPRTAGGSLLLFTEKGRHALSNRIGHFRELPELLALARKVGTDVLYLIDYYEGAPGADPTEYCWNKSDYVARADLGGEAGLIEGIRAVRKAGGRVILYVEPFVLHKASALGRQVGKRWSIRTAEGYPDDPYPNDWKLCPASREVQDHMVAVARRLVGEYGANGIHLDSYGNQRGWECVEADHGHGARGDGKVFDEAAKTLVERMHAAMVAEDRDAVLICEGSKFPAMYRWAAGSQDWGPHELAERWTWAASGRIGVFTSGWNLDDLHQVVAMGHRLALGADYWHQGPPEEPLVAWLRANLPDPAPDQRDHRFRRFYGEDFFRVVHQYRNAGLLLGRPMPNVDEVAPRRWDRADAFESNAGLRGILGELREIAPRIDLALQGAKLPAPTAHVRALVAARAALAPIIDGSTAEVVPSDRTGPHAVAYTFRGPGGVGFTAANVGEEAVSLTLPGGGGPLVEHVTGERAAAGAEVEVPPHSARLWGRTRG